MSTVRNVLLVLADDLGWGDTGSYGAEAIATPTIDGLAASGMRFTDAHAASAVCTPSRFALLTGQYPWRSPLHSGVLGGYDPALIPAGRPTLGSLGRDAGRRSGYFGKWHLGLGWRRDDGTTVVAGDIVHGESSADGTGIDHAAGFVDGPTQRGFDRYFGIAASLDMAPYVFLSDDRTVGLPDRPKDLSAGTGQRPGLTVEGWRDDQVDTTIVGEACRWIGEQIAAGEGFLAVVATAAPHRPCTPPEEYRGRSRAGRRGDAVCFVDDLVADLLTAISPVREDTLVIFTSDNGAPVNYPDDGDTFHHRPNGPWRGQKADAWEAGHRIPLLMAGPGIGPGLVCDATVSLLDVMPTLAELWGTTPPDDLDGAR